MTEKAEPDSILQEGIESHSDQHIRTAVDGLLEGCQIIGRDFRYLYLNEAVAKQSHALKERLLGRTMMECYPGIEKTEVFGHIRRCMEQRVSHTMENEFEYPDGSKGWFELRMQPSQKGLLILSLDITERKREEEARKQIEIAKAKEDFLFRTVHDLRGPVSVIQLVLDDYCDNGLVEKYPETRESFDLIERVNVKMQRLIEHLFQFATSEREEILLQKEPVDAAAIMREEIKTATPLMAKKKITASYLPEPSHLVLGDRDALKEVFGNLLENAVKYNRENGTITITHQRNENTLTIHVTDTGIGIAEEDISRLFAPYYRAYAGADIQGTGLGLFIVKGLVEKMGGAITVRSPRSKPWVSGCSSPIPRAPRRAQRSTSSTARSPSRGLTLQKATSRPEWRPAASSR